MTLATALPLSDRAERMRRGWLVQVPPEIVAPPCLCLGLSRGRNTEQLCGAMPRSRYVSQR